MISFNLTPQPPFSLELTVSALRRRPANIIDRWDGATYRRCLTADNRVFDVEVRQNGSVSAPFIEVKSVSESEHHEPEEAIAAALDRMLGFSLDLSEFYALASQDSHLAPMAAHFRGVKPPCFPTVFEAIINGITFQQLTLSAAMNLLNSLTMAFGEASPAGSGYAFPEPEAMAGLQPKTIRDLGFSGQKAQSIITVAEMAARDQFERLAECDNETVRARLMAVKGIGPWTADYVLLRGLGRLDVFPCGDVGARNNLQRLFGLPGKLDQADVDSLISRFQPYGGMVYFHLLLSNQLQAGILNAEMYS